LNIRAAGAREPGKWLVPSKGLPKDFAAQFADLDKLTVSSATVRRRTAKWVAIMREAKG